MTSYPQLEGRALTLLADACRAQSIAEVGRRLGYSRPAVSMALRGKYVGHTKTLAAKIFEVFADRVPCPFLDTDIAPEVCASHRDAPIPSGPRAAINHWRACRHCVFNPANLLSKEASHG